MITGDDRWWQVCDRIATAVNTELTTPVCRASVVPGLIAWDDCTCGILAVTWSILMGSDQFPQEKVQMTGNCMAAWEVAEIVLQVIRCAPGPDARGNAPTPDALSAAARLLDTDATQMHRASERLLCQMKDAADIVDYMVNRNSAQGPEGGCVGSELRMLVGLPRSV